MEHGKEGRSHAINPPLSKNLSAQDFLRFGTPTLAYIRRVKINEQPACAIHAADGTPLSVVPDMSTAEAVIHHNDLENVTLH